MSDFLRLPQKKKFMTKSLKIFAEIVPKETIPNKGSEGLALSGVVALLNEVALSEWVAPSEVTGWSEETGWTSSRQDTCISPMPSTHHVPSSVCRRARQHSNEGSYPGRVLVPSSVDRVCEARWEAIQPSHHIDMG